MDKVKNYLQQWDEGETITSVEMGGLGTGYEHVIQRMAIEIIRSCIFNQFSDVSFDEENWPQTKKIITDSIKNTVSTSDPSGAQYGAAFNLGLRIFRSDTQALNDAEIENRLIKVNKEEVIFK